jgi:SPP1 gp7 family putative phage head morphogenesis protein
MSATSQPAETSAHEEYLRRVRSRDEPTQTRTLRQDYAQRLRGAWGRIRAAARTAVLDRDVFGLQTEALASTPRRRQFDHDRVAQSVQAFRRWLTTQAQRDIVNEYGRGGNEYIREAYARGVRDARVELNTLDVEALQATAGLEALQEDTSEIAATALQIEPHAEQLEAMLNKNLSSLEGLTADTAQDLSRELTEGLQAGESPNQIAQTISDRIESIGITRATVIARTEIMDSYNTARLQEWESAGVEQVGVLIAADACPVCQAYNAGEPYQASKAYGNLPKHPNCRCSHHVWTGDNT